MIITFDNIFDQRLHQQIQINNTLLDYFRIVKKLLKMNLYIYILKSSNCFYLALNILYFIIIILSFNGHIYLIFFTKGSVPSDYQRVNITTDIKLIKLCGSTYSSSYFTNQIPSLFLFVRRILCTGLVKPIPTHAA